MGRWFVRSAMAAVMLTVSAHALAEAPPQFETVARYASIVTQRACSTPISATCSCARR